MAATATDSATFNPNSQIRIQDVFSGDVFRLTRAKRGKKKKRRSCVIPIERLIEVRLGGGLHSASGNDSVKNSQTQEEDEGKSNDENLAEKTFKQQLPIIQHRVLSALTTTQTVNVETIQVHLQNLTKKTAVTLLMELSQCLRLKVNFVEVGPTEGPSHAPRFIVLATVGDRAFTRVCAGNKRDCKNGAAYLAWKTLIQEQASSLKTLLMDMEFCPFTRPKFLALLAQLKYLKLVQENPLAFTGRRVLAAIIMEKQQATTCRDSFRVVSLATGNRCILTSKLRLDGTAVNDSHAEVLVRRAFMRYLSYQLTEAAREASSKQENILEDDPSMSKHKIKSSVLFHLYISDAPCGDAALFTKSEEMSDKDKKSREPLFTSKQQGLLRTKIEAGEGSIPTERGGIQSLISLQFGGRLRTMTCSDKILKWNVVGLQGALLSHFLQPVYLDSVAVGTNFAYGHICRAFYHRLRPAGEFEDWSLPCDYRVCCPNMGYAGIENPWQDTEKSSAVAMVWNHGGGAAEVLDGTTGHLMYVQPESGEAIEDGAGDVGRKLPSICKRVFLDDFRSLCDTVGADKLRHIADTYQGYKTAASPYQQAKARLISRLQQIGYGGWLKKPQELEFFC